MHRLHRTWTFAALAAVALGVTFSLFIGGAFGPAAATGASPAATPNAATGASAESIFGCRASVARVALAGMTAVEPTVANNATTPCVDDTAAVQKVSLLGDSSLLNLGTVGPAGVTTYEIGSLGGATSPAVTSVANVNAITLSLGGYTLSIAGPLEAQAAAECDGTTLKTQGTSNLNAITVTGPGLPAAGETLEIGQYVNDVVGGLPAALSALVSITANQQIVTATSVTERLVDINLLSSGGEVVVGEAGITVPDPTVCADNVPGAPTTVTTTTTVPTTVGSVTTVTGANGTATTVATTTTVLEPSGTIPSFLEQCAPGSTLDPTSGDCVIYYDGQTIFVSKPFKGPSGGTVVPLAAARAKFKSPCLAGAGSNYVLLVTAKNIKATGTPNSDRILGLNTGQRIYGLAGNDCIDELAANGKIVDGNGRDRLYVTKGVNRVIGGNGPNIIHGGNGRNWITDGTGNDYIYGGSLHNRIDAYGNEKHIYGGKSDDRIWTNSIDAFVSCGGGKRNTLFGRAKIIAYGKKHGCQVLHHLS